MKTNKEALSEMLEGLIAMGSGFLLIGSILFYPLALALAYLGKWVWEYSPIASVFSMVGGLILLFFVWGKIGFPNGGSPYEGY